MLRFDLDVVDIVAKNYQSHNLVRFFFQMAFIPIILKQLFKLLLSNVLIHGDNK